MFAGTDPTRRLKSPAFVKPFVYMLPSQVLVQSIGDVDALVALAADAASA